VYQLQQLEPRDADTWVAFANVALARGNYEHADAAARSALEIDGSHHGAWVALAAGYAGLGWFDEAEACLDQLDRRAVTDRERWRIGRAVNRWAMSKSRWPTIGAVALVVVGVLAVAIAASVPFVAREFRLRSLRSDRVTGWFETAATDAWRFERRLRFGHGAIVVTSVMAFLAAVFWL
jgi:tetratricopeptide (TPR) repeat protein